MIKQWKPILTDSPPDTHPLLRWRLDKIRLDRTTANYICVNEASLFSFLLPSMAGKKPLYIQQLFITRLRVFLLYHFFPKPALRLFDACAVLYGKSDDRSLIGCINNMRELYEFHFFNERGMEEAEQIVNQTPFQGPNYRMPVEEFLKLRLLFEDPDRRMITFRMPKKLIFAARRAFDWNDPPALCCFDRSSEENGMLSARLSIDDLIVLHGQILELLEKPGSFKIKKEILPVSIWLKTELAKLI